MALGNRNGRITVKVRVNDEKENQVYNKPAARTSKTLTRQTLSTLNKNLPPVVNRDRVRTVLGDLPNNFVSKKTTQEKQLERPDCLKDKPQLRRVSTVHNLPLQPKKSMKNDQNQTKKTLKPIPESKTLVQNESQLNPSAGCAYLSSIQAIAETNQNKLSGSGFSTHGFLPGLSHEPPCIQAFNYIPEYLEDIHDYLFRHEKSYVVGDDYLLNSLVTPRMRAILIDWLVRVGCHFDVVNETIHVTVRIIDRFLSINNTITRTILQLVGVTSLLIACKYEETFGTSVTEFASLTDNTCSKVNIVAMEKFILKTIEYDVSLPTALLFYRRLYKIAVHSLKYDVNFDYKTLYHSATFILELALVDFEACQYLPSQLGASALALSMMINKTDTPLTQMWQKTLQQHSRYTLVELKPSMVALCNILLRALKEPKLFMSVLNKYSNREHSCVSVSTIMRPINWENQVSMQLHFI